MTSDSAPVIQMVDITKTFGGTVKANDGVSLNVWPATIHAVIGENGAGKSTLMNILYGRYQPERGRIRLRGEDVRIELPARAIALGIGMVSQHTSMIPALPALDNVILGAEPAPAGILDRSAAERKVREIAGRLGIQLDWKARAGTLSVAACQKAEIVKALYRGAGILIMDEPTATLAPQEADALFAVLHSLVDSGTTILFVTHKLREVTAHSSYVTVLRGGHSVAERPTSGVSAAELLSLMVGQRTTVPGPLLTGGAESRPPAPGGEQLGQGGPADSEATFVMGERNVGRGQSQASSSAPLGVGGPPPVPTLEVRGITVLGDRRAEAVRGVSLDVAPGGIVGIAGVDGSGQRELAEAVVGLRRPASGAIRLDGEEISRLSVEARLRRGVAYIPEDRLREGLIPDFSIAENLLLGRHRDPEFGGGTVLELPLVAAAGEAAVREHRIRAGGGDVTVRNLSGGNQQKVIIARALEGRPRLLVAMQPTRGLDVEASRFVYDSIRRASIAGLATLLFSLDLDEIFEMADRIAVMFNGGIAGILARSEATPESVGKLMLEGRA